MKIKKTIKNFGDWICDKKIENFSDWIFMAEKGYGEKFEEKHKKCLNIIRIVGLILIIWNIPLLCCHLAEMDKPIFFKAAIAFIVLYILIVVYKAWVKGFWNFLKKDSIVHYIFLAVIPAAIIFLGYQYIYRNHWPYFNQSANITQSDKVSNEINADKNEIAIKSEYDEIIDRLNGFYSALFTAIAIIAAILALGGWRTIKELKEKLEKFKEVEEKVDFLHEKKNLARWAQELFDKDEKNRIISSAELILNPDDQKKYERIREKIIEDATDDGWLMIVYAKLLTQNKSIENFEKVKKIYEYIGNRDLLKEDSDINSTLFHLCGLLYWDLYDFKKNEIMGKSINAKWRDWWSNNNENYDLLEKSKKYYGKSLEVRNTKKETSDETLGNIAVVLIELSKFQAEESEKSKYLNEALDHLNKRKKDYNTYWDSARAKYYIDPNANEKEYKQLLMSAAEDIESIKDKKFFITKMEEAIKEIGLSGQKGFPGDDALIKRLKEYLNMRYLTPD
ncbi:MAG: hypothetical protein NT166_04015 [Candidatus Aminicenantes bacterium]|nr:hypothetical protein [Candidatus Aminicenantes bacterium]